MTSNLHPLQPNWVDLPTANQRFGYSLHYLRQLCRDEQITAAKIGGQTWVVYAPSLENYIEESGRTPYKNMQ